MNNQKNHNRKQQRELPILAFKFSDLFTVDYRIITALLIALPLMIYWQVYDFELFWDDIDALDKERHLSNPFVETPSFANFWQLFAQPYFGMYIPVSYTFWSVLKTFSDFLSLPFNSVLHLSNVALHIVNGLLVFVILKQFILNKWAVLIGALFFLLHPIQVEAVSYVSEFRGLLAFTFSVSALYFYLKNQTNLYYVPFLLFILAILSKPSAVVLVLFVFIVNYFYCEFKLAKNIQKTLPFALIALFLVMINTSVQPLDPDSIIAVWQRPFAWLDSIVFYLTSVIYPFYLSASYALSPKFIGTQWWFYPLAFLPLGLGYLLWLKRKKYEILVFAVLLFLAGFFTTSGFVTFGFQRYSLVADRYLYFAMLGVAFLLAIIFNKTKHKFWQGLIIATLLVFTSISAFKQIPLWQNALKLWSHSKNYELNVQYAHDNLAVAFQNEGLKFYSRGEYQQALVYFNKAIKQYPQHLKKKLSGAFVNKGAVFFQQKEYGKALDNFSQAIVLNPNNSKANNNIIYTFLSLKQCKKVRKAINSANINQVKMPKSLRVQLRKTCPNK